MTNNKEIKEIFEFALQNHNKNNLKVAEEFYKKVLKIDQNHFKTIFLLGSLSGQIKKFDIAKQLLEKAVQIDELLTGKKSFISHIVHDEIVLDVTDDERDYIVDIKKVFSENRLGNYLVNLKAGKNYLELEDLKL